MQLLEADINFAFYLICANAWYIMLSPHNALNLWNFGGCQGAKVQFALLLMTISYGYLITPTTMSSSLTATPMPIFDISIPSLPRPDGY